MGCGDTCPVYPGKRYLDWDLHDPAGKPIEDVIPIVDDIDRRVQALLVELMAPTVEASISLFPPGRESDTTGMGEPEPDKGGCQWMYLRTSAAGAV